MAVTVVGIVYSPNQNRIRRCIVSDEHDSHVYGHSMCMVRGEKFMTIPHATYCSFSHPQQLEDHIANILGSPPSNHRCIVVNANNEVTHIVGGDPIIDEHPAGIIIQDDAANLGDIYDFANQYNYTRLT